ncbi:MAG: hypothetical protein HC803_07870 [Saprospiraceae bacterium]|nr:hypothetical protein [Saprospiraceae bacterium]
MMKFNKRQACSTIIIISYFLIFIGCGSKNNYFKESHNVMYFEDYNIFENKGIHQFSKKPNLGAYVEITKSGNTTKIEAYYDEVKKETLEVDFLKDSFYFFNDIYDGPKHYYSKIIGNKIIRYSYNHIRPEDFNKFDESPNYYNLVPACIEVITKDKQIIYNSEQMICKNQLNKMIPLDSIEYYAVKPFEFNLKDVKEQDLVFSIYHYDDNGELWYYNNQKDEKIKGGGIYGYPKKSPLKYGRCS